MERIRRIIKVDQAIFALIIILIIFFGVEGHNERQQLKQEIFSHQRITSQYYKQMLEQLSKAILAKQQLEQEKVKKLKQPTPAPQPTPEVIIKRIRSRSSKPQATPRPWYDFFKSTR